MRNDPAGATGEAMPYRSTSPPFYREEHHPAEAARVRALPADELTTLYDALEAMSEALLSALNRPHCNGAVRQWIETEDSRVNDVRSYTVQELERRPMTGDDFEDSRRMACIAAWDLKECGGSVQKTLAKLARMQADHEAAAFAARRGR